MGGCREEREGGWRNRLKGLGERKERKCEVRKEGEREDGGRWAKMMGDGREKG